MPKVTVLMPVYNGERYLDQAIRSILEQSLADFVFLVIDDGSTDKSARIVESYRDARIQLVRNESNLKLIATLNKGFELATGEYIARMDCDDVSLPRRLEKQVAFLDSHPGVGACGTWFQKIGDERGAVRTQSDPEIIRCGTLFNSMIAHPTVMLRKSMFLEHALCYNPAFRHAEDFELWARALDHFELANVPEVLLRYRMHAHQVTRLFADEQMESTGKIRAALLARLGIQATAEELALHQAVCTGKFPADRNFLKRADRWLCQIKSANDDRGLYPEPAFATALLNCWFTICYKALKRGVWSPVSCLKAGILKQTGLSGGPLARTLANHVITTGRNLLGH